MILDSFDRRPPFESFFAQRREALLEVVEEAMGKPAARDLQTHGPVGEASESADAFAEEDDDPDDVDDDLEPSND